MPYAIPRYLKANGLVTLFKSNKKMYMMRFSLIKTGEKQQQVKRENNKLHHFSIFFLNNNIFDKGDKIVC